VIDEEDEEEILKKGITWKSVIKNLLIIATLVLGAFLIYSSNTAESQYNIYIGFMLICTASMLIQIQKTPPEPIRQTLSILKCKFCGLVKVRNYKDGDFVFMESGKCNECNKPMEINQIYSVKLKKPTEQTKEEKEAPLKAETSLSK